MSITIHGAGAIGGLTGADLAKAGEDDELERERARRHSPGNWTAPGQENIDE